MLQKMRNAVLGALILSAAWFCPAAARQITDMAGGEGNGDHDRRLGGY